MGCRLVFSDWNIGLQKLNFQSLEPKKIGVNSFKNECNKCKINFLLLWALKYKSFLSPYHVQRSFKKFFFKNWINLLETTILHCFWQRIFSFYSNIFTFSNQNKKFHMSIFLFFILCIGLFLCLLFKSLKKVLLYLIKSFIS